MPASTNDSPAPPTPVVNAVTFMVPLRIDATFGVRVSAVTVRVTSLLPTSLAAPAAPIGTRLMKSERAPASLNGLMLRPWSARFARSSAELVIVAAIDV
ncbi:hypothetical protein BamIOP4010DRAFT_6443 [Burkholderia ambifaria IOP40-10]|uniref:Uncharacterized protein n=1 Tax=Burkholderia ambifaria IOP40-10 TaxID=396596 RepID=B1FQY2_9BURK|nr:hypothetical protein BamIOP4010DRAFT_6443 [Burkholderia ambifaria IOP40-10]